ncbi:SMC domain protein [Desulfamplus magnetovallimortis]|uniref:SMC domain protein n=1 Tax=Desulfamplus magnetovallimortis TaxID=1246637 RepID=A0A1W1HH80_9BACT|nr:AAA family ATPase [Desulfamplus magnetovallimortis]SLM31861.1 SMC domain protein [Desulfamplus magnetovallimortis]
MKILELRFKNLNSLYGEWIIDFTTPEYISNGIFALTGPTGAGKSTILDAVCLALYGATPRLGKITKSTNEIMSRQTGECYSELLFESISGKFRCHWEQRRARKKIDGALQTPEHQILDGESGKPIETKKSLVAGEIEKNTGMDFDRFTRSILLAQGGFDTFLKADVEQKSKILEQITGTEIYTEISKRVHEKQREEGEKLKILQAETSGIVLLEPEQENQIKQDIEKKGVDETELFSQNAEKLKAINWLKTIENLKNEIRLLDEAKEELKRAQESFKPELSRLDLALKAGELDGEHATLVSVRKQQAEDKAALAMEETKLPELEALLKSKKEIMQSAEQQSASAGKALEQQAPLIQRVRSLDQKISGEKKNLEAHEKAYNEEISKINSDKKLKIREHDRHEKINEKLKIVEDYLTTHSSDEWLVGGLGGIEEQLASLLGIQKKISIVLDEEKRLQELLNQSCKKVDDINKKHETAKKRLENALQSIENAEKDLTLLLDGRLLREYRTEKETLLREMAFLAKIAELEDHRLKLEDGKPCPLCGSLNHPFAEGNVPVPDETERKIESVSQLIQSAEQKEMTIKKLEASEKKAQKSLADIEKLQSDALNEKNSAEKSLFDLKNNLIDLNSEFKDRKKVLGEKLQPLGVEEVPDNELSVLTQTLRKRVEKWKSHVNQRDKLKQELMEIKSELKSLEAIIETRCKSLTEKQKALDSEKQEYENHCSKRHELFGDKNPDAEEMHLNKEIDHARKKEKEAGKLLDEVNRKVASATTSINNLKERISKRVSELEKLEYCFDSSLKNAQFAGEKEFVEARLSPVERERLKEKAKNLDNRETELKTRQKDKIKSLESATAEKLTDKPIEELEPQLKSAEEKLREIRDEIAALKHRLNENIAAKKRIEDKQSAIDAQKKECLRWAKLHELIGSSDGKKYRNFAQGLTFELMVSHANRQLAKMSDRYLLIRDNENPLELNVIDNYQAGEVRSSRNLSGGESFIVSLTLALGLSKMASQKVRVDSLFLDEGFGTLDEDALETSLETLSNLQQDGKVIGIISHVSALKERIGTQITISPLSGGKSNITGPGCRRVATGF